MNAAPSMNLTGRVALVTGASSGIGRATAVSLAALGAKVVGVAREEMRLAALNRETGCATLSAPLEKEEACEWVVEEARRLGPVTILVHAAGRGAFTDRPIFEQSREDWRATMAINLDSSFELCRLVSRDIRDERWGRIVIVSSTAGEVGAPAMSPYCASKHGVIGLMRSVAHDVAPFNGTCNAVLPGWVRSEMSERDAQREAARRGMDVEAVWAERAKTNPAKRMLTAEEVAATICYLASDAGSGVNGQAVTVSLGSVW